MAKSLEAYADATVMLRVFGNEIHVVTDMDEDEVIDLLSAAIGLIGDNHIRLAPIEGRTRAAQ